MEVLPSRGRNSLRCGKLYETVVKEIMQKIMFNGVRIVVDDITAGAGSGKDIKFKCEERDLSIEIKNGGAFEGGGTTLKHNGDKWVITEECYLKTLMGEHNPFGGKKPGCLNGDITSAKWKEEKSQFVDEYIDQLPTAISEYYRLKGDSYIQIKGKGLYHTGEDPLVLGVPLFTVPTRLRTRMTKHMHKKHKVPTDVTAALVFYRKNLIKSPYCLETKLPPSMQMEVE